ncbi:hypothetical protein R5R35_006139 [Gryllus longicercus]
MSDWIKLFKRCVKRNFRMTALQLQYFFPAIRKKHIIIFLILFVILHFFGAFTHIFEEDFFENFQYPLEGDIRVYVEQMKNHEKPSVQPINEYNYPFLSTCEEKCKLGHGEKLRLVYIVKSATNHFDRRRAIRNTWGYEKRFSDVPIRTVFILGKNDDVELQRRIEEEQKHYRDVVQADFVDTYFNNTIKTMIGFKWAMLYCTNSKFYMFSDDDMYVSTKNVLRFVRNPTHYPQYMIDPNLIHDPRIPARLVAQHVTIASYPKTPTLNNRNIPNLMDFELPDDVELFTGFVFFSAPHRHYSSKWYISLSEYPYHMWPPYVTAGAYILSSNALENMYYASYFTKHFRFDDVYLGILAKKMGIEPYHCNEFYFYKKEYKIYQYRYVIASHGYHNPEELIHVWNEMKSAGYA